MTTYANKDGILLREKLNELDKRVTPAGYDIMRAETRYDQHELLGIGRRNIIINGDMRIAQRSTSENGLTTQAYTTVDRFGYNMHNNGSCQRTDSQESSGGPPGFPYSKKMLFTTTQTTNSNSRNQIRYMVEGYDMGGLAWGTNRAKDVTISFWAKSNVTGYHAFSVINQSETHSFVADYSIPTKDEWHHIKITIPGPNVASWNDNQEIGIRLAWDLGSGPDFAVSAGQRNMWLSGWYYRTSRSVFPALVANGYLQLTGVQLELGREATPFEHRPIGQELRLCRRYYETSFWPYNITTFASGMDYYDAIQFRQTATTNDVKTLIPWMETKRNNPNITWYNASSGNAGSLYVITSGSGSNVNVNSTPGVTPNYNPYINTNGNISDGATVYIHYAAYAEL